MNLRQIRIFLTVCKCNCNITAAAKELHMTQPSVSIAIKEIENYYNIVLFDRLSRRLYLTEAGKELLKYAERLVSVSEDLEEKMLSWNKAERIRIGASLTIGSEYIAEYVQQLKARIENVDVRVLIEPSRYLEKKLLTNELDIALVETSVHIEDLNRLEYRESPLVIIAHKDRIKADKISLEEFIELPLLLREKGSGIRETFDRVMEEAGVNVDPIWEAQSTMGLINAVSMDMGVSIISKKILDSRVSDKNIKEIKVEDMEFIQHFSIVYHKDKVLTPAIEELIRICCG
ncbi:LysR family transcriptional regulator [Lachnospira pectinoschiza]|uniref:DNA-binding transcriptional regulator, LysR family n=1 Tax=Lachnospira pectinoschiza TaxID=28052 RepID=A0A1G9ZIM8_9FIRM|nr:LysR family transcriptional regulator [Lachnospira pectinoschiza]SDN20975.1 DNA-binding transcriptional regulator, LysR family [Lachnospira pectinoschiza]